MYAIPGLNSDITIADLQLAASLYNTQPFDTVLSETDTLDYVTTEVAQIIARHKIHDIRVHIAHRHEPLKSNEILLRTPLQTLSGYWTTPVKIDQVDLHTSRGHTFLVHREFGLFPIDVQHGPSNPSSPTAAFLEEVTRCILSNGVENRIGIQWEHEAGNMMEFPCEIGNLLLNERLVEIGRLSGAKPRLTAWSVDEGGAPDETSGKTACFVTTAGHEKVIDQKVTALCDVLEQLRSNGVLIQQDVV